MNNSNNLGYYKNGTRHGVCVLKYADECDALAVSIDDFDLISKMEKLTSILFLVFISVFSGSSRAKVFSATQVHVL